MKFPDAHLYFDDIAIGQEWRSLGRTITETDVVSFAGLSGDFNPIHVDHAFARNTPFGRPIAHGLLVLAVSSGLGVNAPPMRTLAVLELREWHFREPIFFGDTVHVLTRVVEKVEKARGRRGEVTWKREVINQDGKIVLEGITRTLVEGRGTRPKEETRT
ncbi:MAG: dehydratase [Planctomycetia bacterium]|nr:dehydratase [Planctomycetia bacterium]